jgi:hypothetical protein
VVADTIAGTEVGMRVVVEGAPADAAGILRIGGKLIVDPCVTQSMLALALVVISRFGGEGMSNELSIKVAGMIGLFEREAEVVHRENIFQKLGLLKIPDTPCLARGVKGMSKGVGAGVEAVIVE